VLPIGASRTGSERLPSHVDLSSTSSGPLNPVLVLPVSTAGDGEQCDEEIGDLPIQGFILVYVNKMFDLSPSTPLRDLEMDFRGLSSPQLRNLSLGKRRSWP